MGENVAMNVYLHLAMLLPILALLVHTESMLRDHQWAYSAVEDLLVSFSAGAAAVLPSGWAHITAQSEHISIVPTLSDQDFGIAIPGALRLRRTTEYCQWAESSHETCHTTTDDAGESTENCQTDYSYDKGWRERLIPSTNFQERGHHNPQADPFPSSHFATSELKVGGISIPVEIVRTLQGASAMVLSADNAAAVGADSAATTANFSAINGLFSYYRQRSVPLSQAGAQLGCAAGDIRVSWEYDAPKELTAIGEIVDGGSSGQTMVAIQTARSPKPVGILHAGVLSAADAFSDRLSPVLWQVVPARVLLVTFAVLEAYWWSHYLGLWWANSKLFVALVISIGSCSTAVILGVLWAALYGLADWQGRETSAPQIQLLVVASSALSVLAASSRQANSNFVTSVARISVSLHRVSDSLFNIRNNNRNAAATVPATDRLKAGGLIVAIMAGLTMSFAAITGGTLNSHSNWLLWAIGVTTTSLSVVLLAATLLTRERLTATNHEAAVPDTVGTLEMDCPVCLESVPIRQGLVIAPCGHTICASCLTAMNASNMARGKCPICRAAVTNTISVSSRVADSDEFKGHFRGAYGGAS